MTADITFIGHSTFSMTDGTSTLLVDPFFTDNPMTGISPEECSCTHIALSHGHFDHVADAPAIAMANNAVVIANWELGAWVMEQGHDRVEQGNPGGKITTDFGWIAFTHAFHSSSTPDGAYAGMANGLMIHIGGTTIYYCGDTGLFGDMKMYGEIYSPDVAILPVGDRFTMGPELATTAAEWIGAPVAIPCHYNTWPPLEVDITTFAPSGVEVRVMEPGETISV